VQAGLKICGKDTLPEILAGKAFQPALHDAVQVFASGLQRKTEWHITFE
jgi:hypothetical protein